MQYNLQEILYEVALSCQDNSPIEPMTEEELKKEYNYFNKKFSTFTFKFAKKVDYISLLCDIEPYTCQDLSVKQLFELQKELRRIGGLANWITLEIHFADETFSYMSFDH